jgi:ribokinase
MNAFLSPALSLRGKRGDRPARARWDILGLGAAAVDDLIYVDRYPEPDTKTQIRDACRQGGGPTATALVAAARLGAVTAYCGVLGADELSRFTIRELEREGVDCAPVVHRDGARPYHSTIIVDLATGQRTILYSAAGVIHPSADAITGALVAGCRLLFVDQYAGAAALRALELAQARGIPVVADVESASDPTAVELLKRADHLIVGIELGRQVTGEEEPAAVVATLAGAGRACCAITAGAQGCWYAERGDPVRHLPALRVQAVDTTGCGDVFHGAYAACIARGEAVEVAMRVATAAAGLKATRPGGRAGIPNRATIDEFLALSAPTSK